MISISHILPLTNPPLGCFHSFPHIIGYDVSGTIEYIDPSVIVSQPHLKIGAKVYSRVPEPCRGTIAEYALSSASATALKPNSLSYAEAASVPLTWLTALQALELADNALNGGLKGKTVFIPGALSGTGSPAIQLAKDVFGAGKVITTVSTPKVSKVQELLGPEVVDQVIDYSRQEPSKIIPTGTVDFFFDTMGQPTEYLHLMRQGGVIVGIAGVPFGSDMKERIPGMPTPLVWVLNTIGAVIKLRAWRYGVQYLRLFMRPSAKGLDQLREWFDAGKLRPVVGRVAKLDDLDKVRAGCQEVLDGKGSIGKFVIEIEP